MNSTSFILNAVVLINLAIAGVVLLTNPIRLQNRTFFLFAFLLSVWTLGVRAVATAESVAQADLLIRLTQYSSLLLPAAFQALCLSMVSSDMRIRALLVKVRPNLLLSQACAILVFSPYFLNGVEMQTAAGKPPLPSYGPAFLVVQIYIAAAFLALISHFVREARKLDGIEKAELQFTLLAVASGVAVVTIASMILQVLLPDNVPQQYGPLASIVMNLIIAYGVATRRILSVSAFLQRATAYLVLAVYLLGLYAATHAITTFILVRLNQPSQFVAPLLAALAVAFSVSPMRGVLQKVSYELFIGRDTLNVSDVSKRGNEIFASISTTDAILDRFFDMLEEGGVDASHSTFLLASRHGFVAWQSADTRASGDTPMRLDSQSALIRELRDHHAPLAADTLRRLRPTPATRSMLRALGRLNVDLAVGVNFKEDLRGVVLLGPRRSGRIYSAAEQDAMRVLCDQLAVALENANLYTEVQNNKIYNDILVDSLLSGVVAVSSEGYISVFNREAQRMTGISAGTALGRAVEILPGELARVLRDTLRTGEPARDQETVLQIDAGDDVPIRCGSSLFHGSLGDVLGALVVFSDQTAQRKLEMQVRRSDRLASIGTLSAGMAHEIKNPLVTVKTFTELLPERYTDEDFRNTFSTLVSKEVQRIDSIVNQLLRFARPATANLNPVSLQDVVRGSLDLLTEQLRQNNIQQEVHLDASEDVVKADASLLEQALVNLTFNAIDAMRDGGTLTVTTATAHPPWHLRQQYHIHHGELHARVSIRDTGCGIDPESIDRVFDPFFTTKEEGTGLGLSISHGIITDHDGLIDVSSQKGIGTTFHIYLPLVQKEAVVS